MQVNPSSTQPANETRLAPHSAARTALRNLDLSPAQLILLAFATGFLLARFFNLAADFPPGFTFSGAVLTDEGWYANSATRIARDLNWHIEGDFNPATSMPAYQVAQTFMFSILGPGLANARLVSALAFIASALIVALILRRTTNTTLALVAVAALAIHPAAFAYSRFAIVEPFAALFALSGVALAINATRQRAWLAGAAVAIAILAKTSMIFAAPVMGLAILLTPIDNQRRTGVLVRACLAVAPAFAWLVAARLLWPADLALFSEINVGDRFVASAWQWIDNPSIQGRVILHVVGAPLTLLAIALTAAAAIISPAFRANRRVWIWAAFIALYLIEMRFLTFNPPRYMLPLLFPVAILTAEAAHALITSTSHKRLPLLLAAALGAALTPAAIRTASIVASPNHSHLTALNGVAAHIEPGAKLAGKFADTVALQAAVRPLNTRLHTHTSPATALRETAPHYLVTLASDRADLASAQSAGASTTLIDAWPVFPAAPEFTDTLELHRLHW